MNALPQSARIALAEDDYTARRASWDLMHLTNRELVGIVAGEWTTSNLEDFDYVDPTGLEDYAEVRWALMCFSHLSSNSLDA